jgi:hypothetical protein
MPTKNKSTTGRRWLAVGCAAMLSMVFSSPPILAQDADETVSFAHVRAQGMLYFKRGLYKQARIQFEHAFKYKQGRFDGPLVVAMAKAYAELTLLKQAFISGERALDLTRAGTRSGDEARGFMDELSSQYGPVEIRSNQESGLIYLHADSSFLNPNKQQVFDSVRIRVSATPVKFPTVIYLPFGNYSANSVPFSISGKQVDTVAIYIQTNPNDTAIASPSGGSIWWYVGATVALAAAGVGAWAYFGDESNRETAPSTYNILILNLVTK